MLDALPERVNVAISCTVGEKEAEGPDRGDARIVLNEGWNDGG